MLKLESMASTATHCPYWDSRRADGPRRQSRLHRSVGSAGAAVYLRAGNTAPELVYVELLRNGKVMRLFPIGAPWHVHVPLAVVEDLFAATRLEVRLGAPRDLRAGAELFAITMFGDEPYGNDAGHE
jgi:hypothetical protein